ncbi:MAG: 2-dehydro-3-deoxygalactonokinase [Clostridia bacterium]|nr:2-dehydro-3-deoxygalactonokinase [Clostridia bacterium]
MNVILIIDGGTTNLRVHLLNADTLAVIDSRKTDGGVRCTAMDGNNMRLKTLLRDTINELLDRHTLSRASVTDCIAYGMITSGMGLVEIPHVPAPASQDDLARYMVTRSFPDVCPFPIRFIPGVRNFAEAVNLSNCAAMDMMRGEETESIGLYQLLHPCRDALFVLPGSHNKFVHMRSDGTILGCMTSISGELLDSITHHTILSDAVGHTFLPAESYSPDLVRAGAAECVRSGLGRAAFAGRILKTLGGQDTAAIQNWILGAVLAEDVKAMDSFTKGQHIQIYIAGKSPLQSAFLDVLTEVSSCAAEPVAAADAGQMGILGALTISGIIREGNSRLGSST